LQGIAINRARGMKFRRSGNDLTVNRLTLGLTTALVGGKNIALAATGITKAVISSLVL